MATIVILATIIHIRSFKIRTFIVSKTSYAFKCQRKTAANWRDKSARFRKQFIERSTLISIQLITTAANYSILSRQNYTDSAFEIVIALLR